MTNALAEYHLVDDCEPCRLQPHGCAAPTTPTTKTSTSTYFDCYRGTQLEASTAAAAGAIMLSFELRAGGFGCVVEVTHSINHAAGASADDYPAFAEHDVDAEHDTVTTVKLSNCVVDPTTTAN